MNDLVFILHFKKPRIHDYIKAVLLNSYIPNF